MNHIRDGHNQCVTFSIRLHCPGQTVHRQEADLAQGGDVSDSQTPLLYDHPEEDAVASAQSLIFGASVTKSRGRQWLHLHNNSVVMDAKTQEGHLLPKLLDLMSQDWQEPVMRWT